MGLLNAGFVILEYNVPRGSHAIARSGSVFSFEGRTEFKLTDREYDEVEGNSSLCASFMVGPPWTEHGKTLISVSAGCVYSLVYKLVSMCSGYRCCLPLCVTQPSYI